MRRVFAWLLTVLLALTSAGGCVAVDSNNPTSPPAQPPPAADDTPEQRTARDIFDRVNAERAERGLEPVVWDEDLAAVARRWSEEMARTGRFEHRDVRELLSSDRLPGFVSVGENIFRSTGPVSAGAIHAGWMRSDGHRANVVNPGWNRLGVGVFCAEDGATWATQEFGRTADAARPPVSEQTPPAEPLARPEPTGPRCR